MYCIGPYEKLHRQPHVVKRLTDEESLQQNKRINDEKPTDLGSASTKNKPGLWSVKQVSAGVAKVLP